MASRFWVGGTGTWDAVTTTNWAASTGGAGGQTVPGSADTVTFDGLSGGGTVTVNTTVTVQSIACGAFTGTLDFSANNNNVTLSAAAGLNGSGSSTRTINLGSGTWTFTGTSSNPINFTTTTNLTLSAASANVVLTATTASTRTLMLGPSKSWGNLTINANSSSGIVYLSSTSVTLASLTVTGQNAVVFPSGGNTMTITNGITATGSSGNVCYFCTDSANSFGTISSANNSTMTWAALRDVLFSGGGTNTATNSFNLGNTSGSTITPPSAGGGSTIFVQNNTSMINSGWGTAPY